MSAMSPIWKSLPQPEGPRPDLLQLQELLFLIASRSERLRQQLEAKLSDGRVLDIRVLLRDLESLASQAARF